MNRLNQSLMALRLEVDGSIVDDLQKHINAERKLLVDLLIRAEPELSFYPVLRDDIREALAQVKEGK